jgi:hypothetical protein
LLAAQGAAAQDNTPGAVNGMGKLLGGQGDGKVVK